MVLQDRKSDLLLEFTNLDNYIKTLLNLEYQRDNILKWFQVLCSHLTTIIDQICKLYKDNKEKHYLKNTILLYLTQIVSSLSLLINILVHEEENQIILKEARKCLIKQISCCLDLLQAVIQNDTVLNDPSGNFIKWMDTALEKISERNFNLSKFDEIKEIFEEVLSHAMSIAQVSLLEDSKSIRGACQTVLSTLKLFENELKLPEVNKAVAKLYSDSCTDKLCSLEKKVNTAVLKMCLKTFSQLTQPLCRIHKFCLEPNNKNRVEDFDSLVADFDLHVDRIMQIGLFAVSCSNDLSKGIKIRSCLASLEALESEIVPTLNSLLLDKNQQNLLIAEILIKYWLEQALSLQNLIFLIIDPFAFCQVIYEESTDLVDNLTDSLRQQKLIAQTEIQDFIQIAKVLQDFLDKSQSEFDKKEMGKIQTKLNDYNKVLDEVEKSSFKLLAEQNSDLENCKRVLKRCKILLTVLKRLWFCFTDDLPEISQRNEEKIIEPTGNNFLDHIINRGKQILEDRSVLYKTPKKNTETKLECRKEVALSRLVHLRKLSFMNFSSKNETSIDLQITDILNEMSQLSTKIKSN